MISYINGVLKLVEDSFVIVEANGMGYNIQMSPYTIGKLPAVNQQVKIFTFMNVSENDISLFGFMSMEELNMFNRLKTVNGVGAKSALGILGVLTPSEISLAVLTEDIKQLSRCPGIGKKTAQRIALELKDKVTSSEAMGQTATGDLSINTQLSNEKADAVEALVTLGFSRSEAVMTVGRLEGDYNSNQLVSQALKLLSR